MDCGVFTVKRAIGRWRRRPFGYKQMHMSLPYSELSPKQNQVTVRDPQVTVVVGKERRVFKVDPHILQDRLLQCVLHRPTTRPDGNELHTSAEEDQSGCIVLLDCDAILFEHVLWLLCNDDPSLPHLNLEELMDFYAQDGA